MLSKIFKVDEELLKSRYNHAIVVNYISGWFLFIFGFGFIVTLITLSILSDGEPTKSSDLHFGHFLLILWMLASLPMTFGGISMVEGELKGMRKLKKGIDVEAEKEEAKINHREEEYKKPYKLIEAGSRKEFEDEMNEFIAKGFVPIGEMKHKKWREHDVDVSWTCHSYKQQLFNENNVGNEV
jgi:hypothetical protein